MYILYRPSGVVGCGTSSRWINDPKPDLNSENFGEDEEDLIIKLQALLGNRYVVLGDFFFS